MARLRFGGFEGGDTATDTYGSGTGALGSGVSVQSSTVRSGNYAMKIAAPSGAVSNWTYGLGPDSYNRCYVLVESRPSTTRRRLLGTGTTQGILLNPNGTLTFRADSADKGTSTTALTDTARWYMVEWRGDAVTSDTLLRIDGVAEVTGSVTSGISFGLGTNDTVADTYTAYYDDWTMDDAPWPGDSKVVLLWPVSDNSVGSGWQKPGGGTTNLYTSVDNTPPIGIADTTNAANAENQIRNASANSNYVANMTTYTNAGIGASDTINAVMAFAFTGAPTATGAKTGSLQITANPTDTATAFQSTSSFYRASGVNAGTYVTGWFRQINPLVSSPSVTKGDNPTLSLNITGGTASRIAMCCFMGIYVDYTPAADPRVPKSSPYPRILAH